MPAWEQVGAGTPIPDEAGPRQEQQGAKTTAPATGGAVVFQGGALVKRKKLTLDDCNKRLAMVDGTKV